MCFGVATIIATCFFMVVLVVSLLHGLAGALLHERVVFKARCSSDLDGESRTPVDAFLGLTDQFRLQSSKFRQYIISKPYT